MAMAEDENKSVGLKVKLYRLKNEWREKEEVILYIKQHGKSFGVKTIVDYDVDEPLVVTREKLDTQDKKTFDSSLGRYIKAGFHTCHSALINDYVLPCLKDEKCQMAIVEFGMLWPLTINTDANGLRAKQFVVSEYCTMMPVVSSNRHWFDLLSDDISRPFLEEVSRK